MRARLESVGRLMARRKRQLKALASERQELTAKLRAEGITLEECAKLARVSPEAIRIADRRAGQPS